MLLMIVLGLLALFSMIGVSFVLITAEAERSAKATFSETSRRSTSPELLREAAMRVFRGAPVDSWSVNPIGIRNLLTDMYGMPTDETFEGLLDVDVIEVTRDAGTGLCGMSDLAGRMTANFHAAQMMRLGTMVGASEIPMDMGDRWLVEADAMAAVRFMGMYLGFSNGDVYQILESRTSPPILKPVSLTAATQRELMAGQTVTYSGTNPAAMYRGQTYSMYRPFGGTGLTQATGTPKTVDGDFIPFEMLPGIPPELYGTNLARGGDWSADYDSPDFQNMHLAHMTFDPSNGQQTVLPSYWRPDLIAYWYRIAAGGGKIPLYDANGPGTGWTMQPIDWTVLNAVASLTDASGTPVFGTPTPDVTTPKGRVDFLEQIRNVDSVVLSGSTYALAVRRFVGWISFRPAGEAFTGSNSGFGIEWNGTVFQIKGQLDVDNDGNGIPDSIWVDLGLPEMTDASGNRVKPLVAVLCVDLDGRLNVNAHGNDAQLMVGVTSPDGSPLGRGFGPAEVALTTNPTVLAQLLYGDTLQNDLSINPASKGIEGRLGEWGSPLLQTRGGVTLPTDSAGVGVLQVAYPTPADGYLAYSNIAGWNRFMPMILASGAYGGAVNPDFLYGTFADPLGVMSMRAQQGGTLGGLSGMRMSGTDYTSMQMWTQAKYLLSGANSNYWVDLTTPRRRSSGGKVQIDNVFTAAELERLLRRHDVDQETLAPRLELVLGLEAAMPVFTTDSYHVPATPAVELPQYVELSADTDLRKNTEDLLIQPGVLVPRRYGSLSEALVRYLRIMENGGDYAAAVGPGTTANASGFVSPEFYQGIPLDPNRRFSDEQWLIENLGTAIPPIPVIQAGRAERQAMARELYVLAKFLTRHWTPDFGSMTLADLMQLPGYAKIPASLQTSLDTPEKVKEAVVSIWLAQWAVNVVDFRDRDSAMTPFWFDPFPDAVTGGDTEPGWTTNPANLICVFGCERPDLLITETFATHMRRTEDTAEEADGPAATTKDATDPDITFDQKRRQVGSLFLELYNPWGAGEAAPSAELRAGDWSDEVVARSVDLTRAASDGTPVWRMGFRSVEADKTADAAMFELESPDLPDMPNLSTIEREKLAFERTLYFVPDPVLPTGDLSETANTLRFSMTVGGTVGNTAAVVRPGEPIVIGPYDTEWKTRTPLAKGEHMEVDWTETRYIDLRGSTGGLEVHYNYDATSATNDGIDPFNTPGVLTLAVDRVCDAGTWGATGGDSPRFSVSEPPTGAAAAFYNVKWGADPLSSDPANDYYCLAVSTYPALFDDAEIQKNGCAGQGSTAMPPNQYRNRLAYLQRLADPRLPFNADPTNAEYNPYITIDKAPIDLVTYNGWNPGSDGGVGSTESNEPYPPGLPLAGLKMADEKEVVFRSRERGYFRQNDTLLAGSSLDLWTQEPILDQKIFGDTQTLRELAKFHETKSYVVPGFTKSDGTAIMEMDLVTGAEYFHQYLSHSLGAPVNLCFMSRTLSGGILSRPTTLVLPPNEYFSLLTWNNSPYNSRMELTYVPNTSASRLLAAPIYAPVLAAEPWALVEPGFALASADAPPHYESPTVVGIGGTPNAGDGLSISPYAREVIAHVSGGTLDGYRSDGRWYPYLMNFFDTGPVRLDDPATPTFRYSFASNFGQILDFVDTPSPYVGAQAWRREPGRINFNAIPMRTDGNVTMVWTGLQATPSNCQGMTLSRFGNLVPEFYGETPSLFPNPLRASSMFGTVYNGDDTGDVSDLIKSYPLQNVVQVANLIQPLPSDLSELRGVRWPGDVGGGGTDDPREPVLSYDEKNTGDSTRNVRFRYEQMQRMANLTTTQSNVYAVWVTLGYFRVMGHEPDGQVKLGAEVEGSRGVADRPRAFYIFDRSIPTGYQPGSDRGADRAVLLRRIINE